MILIDKLKKSRQSNIDVNGHKFTITRPTDYDALVISRDSINMLDVVKQFTVDWDLSELEIIPGGSGDQIPFDTELFAEWVSDQPAIWEPLANAIIAAYKAHTERRESTAKN